MSDSIGRATKIHTHLTMTNNALQNQPTRHATKPLMKSCKHRETENMLENWYKTQCNPNAKINKMKSYICPFIAKQRPESRCKLHTICDIIAIRPEICATVLTNQQCQTCGNHKVRSYVDQPIRKFWVSADEQIGQHVGTFCQQHVRICLINTWEICSAREKTLNKHIRILLINTTICWSTHQKQLHNT